MEKINFREKIQELMKQKKVSMAKLARNADLSFGTVFYFLKGKSDIKTSNLEKLFEVLNSIE